MSALADPAREAEFWEGVRYAGRFFMGDADVHRALVKLTTVLDEAGIAYAIAGGMALNEYGYRRVTTDVDVLLTIEGLAECRARSRRSSTRRCGRSSWNCGRPRKRPIRSDRRLPARPLRERSILCKLRHDEPCLVLQAEAHGQYDHGDARALQPPLDEERRLVVQN